MTLRDLSCAADGAAVLDLYRRAADYALLDAGRAPDSAMVQAYFDDCVPGGDPAQSVKLGAEDTGVEDTGVEDTGGPRLRGRLIGIADMGFGYPLARDAYIGLLLLDPACRGQGLGPRILAALADMARTKGASRLLVAVLLANPRGLAFWQREGFVLDETLPPNARYLRLGREVSPVGCG